MRKGGKDQTADGVTPSCDGRNWRDLIGPAGNDRPRDLSGYESYLRNIRVRSERDYGRHLLLALPPGSQRGIWNYPIFRNSGNIKLGAGAVEKRSTPAQRLCSSAVKMPVNAADHPARKSRTER